MRRFFFSGLAFSLAVLAACDSNNEGPKNDASSCWDVIDTTRGEAMLAVDTGRLELVRSGDLVRGLATWKKSNYDPMDSVAGTISGDSLSLSVLNLKSREADFFAGKENANALELHRVRNPPSSPILFPSSRVWVGTRKACGIPD